MDRAPRDGRWIIAINRQEPDCRAVIRWDPERFGDDRPWRVASCDYSYPTAAFTDWMSFPPQPAPYHHAEAERLDAEAERLADAASLKAGEY